MPKERRMSAATAPHSRVCRREGDPDQAEHDPGSVCRAFRVQRQHLRHREQDRRVLEGQTRAYLLVIDRDPKSVDKAPGARPE